MSARRLVAGLALVGSLGAIPAAGLVATQPGCGALPVIVSNIPPIVKIGQCVMDGVSHGDSVATIIGTCGPAAAEEIVTIIAELLLAAETKPDAGVDAGAPVGEDYSKDPAVAARLATLRAAKAHANAALPAPGVVDAGAPEADAPAITVTTVKVVPLVPDAGAKDSGKGGHR